MIKSVAKSVLLTCLVCVAAQGQTVFSYPNVAATAECAGKPDSPGCMQTPAPPRSASIVSPVVESQPVSNDPAPKDAISAPPQTEPPTEFQEFVEASTGLKLPLFGYSLFASVPTTFAPVDGAPVTADYVIGPGDEVVVRAWGKIDLDARLLIDRSGDIYLPRIGVIHLAGLRYEQVQGIIRTSIERIFRDFDLTVNLGHLRSIQILVVGRANRPGSYTVSSLSTLVNALFASGGPSNHGSMRHIQLRRDNRVVAELDLYSLLLDGDKSKDVRLLPGDVIYIPPVGSVVAVTGSVNAPGIYELSGEGTTLAQQISVCGGLSSTANTQRARLERIDAHNTRKVEELDLASDRALQALRNGDIIRIDPISPRFDNAVTLRGNVAQPGRYVYTTGMRVKDLIPNVDFLLTRGYWLRQNMVEQSSTGKQSEHESDVRNDVRNRANDINWDYAVIQRMNRVTLATDLISFNLGKALADSSSGENVPLEIGDVLTVFSHSDLSVPVEKRTKLVRLEGEFRAPGVYRVRSGETLKSLVARAGGMTESAYLYGSEFTRESARVLQQKALEEMVRQMEAQLQLSGVAQAASSSNEATAVELQLQTRRAFLEQLKQVRANGRVVLSNRPESTVGELPDIPLEDNDRFFVPNAPVTVSVVGEVHNQSSYIYNPRLRVNDYLKLSGHGTPNADLGKLFVLRPNGAVVSKASYDIGRMRLLPGDVIVLPAKAQKGSVVRNLKDWSQIIGQFGLGLAAIHGLQ